MSLWLAAYEYRAPDADIVCGFIIGRAQPTKEAAIEVLTENAGAIPEGAPAGGQFTVRPVNVVCCMQHGTRSPSG